MTETPHIHSAPTAIVGGGFLGRPLAERLRSHPAFVDSTVVVATRSGRFRTPLPDATITPFSLDLTCFQGLPIPVKTAAALVVAVAPNPDANRRELYVDGTRRLLDHMGSALRRIVFISSTSALPDRDGWVYEDDAELPGPRGLVQRDAEDVVRAFAASRDIPWIALRLGGLYGPGRELGRVYARRGAAKNLGDGHNPTNLVHLDDAVTATVAALCAPPHVRGVIHVCDDDHRTRRVMYDAMAQLHGLPAPSWDTDAPTGPPTGKRVSNLRLKRWLDVRLAHPEHAPPLATTDSVIR